MLKVLSNILVAIDAGDLSALVLLDLSAAFDTMDHDILVRRLETSYGLSGSVLQWFQTYLVGRRQYYYYYYKCTDYSDASQSCRGTLHIRF